MNNGTGRETMLAMMKVQWRFSNRSALFESLSIYAFISIPPRLVDAHCLAYWIIGIGILNPHRKIARHVTAVIVFFDRIFVFFCGLFAGRVEDMHTQTSSSVNRCGLPTSSVSNSISEFLLNRIVPFSICFLTTSMPGKTSLIANVTP